MDQEAVLEGAVTSVLNAVEKDQDDRLQRLAEMENLDDEEMDMLREKRKNRLKKQHADMNAMKANGHGEYRVVHDERAFFQACKESEVVVAHFGRDATRVRRRRSV